MNNENYPSMINTIRGTIERLREDGYNIPETALRGWVKNGEIPARQSGKTYYIYYPHVIGYLTGGVAS